MGNVVRIVFCISICVFLFFQTEVLYSQSVEEKIEKMEAAERKKNYEEAGSLASSIGKIYGSSRSSSEREKAIEYYEKSIEFYEKVNNRRSLAHAYNNLGMVYGALARWDDSKNTLQKSAEIWKYLDKKEYAAVLFNGGMVFYNGKRYGDAIKKLNQALDLQKDLKDWVAAKATLEYLAKTYDAFKDPEMATHYRKLADGIGRESASVARIDQQESKLQSIADSLHMSLEQVRTNLETERKEKERSMRDLLEKSSELKSREEELDEVENQLRLQTENASLLQQRLLFAGGSLLLILVLFIVLFFGYRGKQKANKALALMNEEIISQKEELEKEKEKSERLLLNILPKATAEELMEKGYATPQHYSQATVLFTDFKGFTTAAERLSPEELIKELETCFHAFDEICERFNLEKIKTIGDAYMCVGGVPISNFTNPKDAVLAGLEMQKFMAEWKEKKEILGQHCFELRLGIHTGPVVAGVVGKNKFAYDIWGDTVNLASRMESSGEVGKVNISEDTYWLIRDDFECTYRGEIDAKNKGKVRMYFVEGIRYF